MQANPSPCPVAKAGHVTKVLVVYIFSTEDMPSRRVPRTDETTENTEKAADISEQSQYQITNQEDTEINNDDT